MVTSLSTFIVSRDTNYMQAPEVLSERIDDIPLLLHMLVSMGSGCAGYAKGDSLAHLT